jgi:hypothetical protein
MPTAVPAWTLTQSPVHAAAPVPTASLERLQARLARLQSPISARVVLSAEERSGVADRHTPTGLQETAPW